MSEVAYLRDASWFNRPDVHSPKRLHRESEKELGTPEHRASLCRRCFRP